MATSIEQLQQQIKDKALTVIDASFEFDELLLKFARGEASPRHGQLEAIDMIFKRAHRMMEFHVAKPVQEQKHTGGLKFEITRGEGVIESSAISATQDTVTDSTGQPQV